MLVTARVAAIGRLPARTAPPLPEAAPALPMASRRAWIEGAWQHLQVWHFDALAPDQRVPGPAIVESDTTTVLLLPGDTARLDARGWLDIALE